MKSSTYPLSDNGNSVTVSHVKDDWYMLVASDHYDDNHVGLFMHKNDIEGLAKFLDKFVQEVHNNDN